MTMILVLLALKSLLVAAVTLGLLRLTRKRSAAERSTIAHLGLFALVALPLASLALPTLDLPLPAPIAQMATVDLVEQTPTPLPSRDKAAPIAAGTSSAVSAEPVWTGALSNAARYAFLLPTLVLLALTLAALLRLVGLRARAE